ncbi:ABC transporter permease [Aquibium sp. A9E412]|nr:ABC transporter permease [Aquibium sp. A9E412]
MAAMADDLSGLDPATRALAEGFLADPLGEHSPNLQRLLYTLRSAPAEGKHVLVEEVPGRRWRLARLGGRGRPVVLLDERFDDLAAAERRVFLLRLAARGAAGEGAA